MIILKEYTPKYDKIKNSYKRRLVKCYGLNKSLCFSLNLIVGILTYIQLKGNLFLMHLMHLWFFLKIIYKWVEKKTDNHKFIADTRLNKC